MACTIHNDTFSAPFGIFYVRIEIQKQIFQEKKKKTVQLPNGELPICKLSFQNIVGPKEARQLSGRKIRFLPLNFVKYEESKQFVPIIV